ncbi:MAG: ABC transporter ATP-binding protein [Clostridia bacterium]
MSKSLEMKHIYKRFPGVLANEDVNLSVEAGEVHALLGENGAGKSTLMNVLCGLYKPTAGEIYVDEKLVKFNSAKNAMAIGIGMVHQHFMLIPTLTVTENCLIGAKDAGKLHLNKKLAAQKIDELAKKYNMNIDPMAKIGDLSVGAMQRVEIIKALYRGARILILDEPTAVLTPQETGELFNMVRSLTGHGFTVLFISHKLNEVKEISDRVTVLRLGKALGTYLTKDCSIEELANLMVGRDVNFTVSRAEQESGETMMSIRDLSLARDRSDSGEIIHNVSIDIHAGEILGIAGVDGNGQSQLVECITGLMKATSGQILYEGEDLTKRTTREIMAHGISHIPQDRQKTGLVMTMALTENFVLQDYYKKQFGKGGLLNWKYAGQYSQKLIDDFSIKTPSQQELAQNLSGGNQQKVIVAREIGRDPKVLIAMHPTRGLDVGAIEYIHGRLIEQRDNGVGILLVSTELEEIMKLSDRVAVMYEGEIMGIIKPSETTIEQIGLMMGGQRLENIINKNAAVS